MRTVHSPLKLAAALAGIVLLGGVAGCTTLAGAGPVGNRRVPQPARPVELERYLGRWYEYGRYEAPFQRGCEAVTADYSRNPDGSVRVVNSCREGSLTGRLRTATGRAKVVDTATGAKLKVSFFGPFYGDYWVLDRAEDYSWAIVGEPSGRYLWVLTRAPVRDPARGAELERQVSALGYDLALFRKTQQ